MAKGGGLNEALNQVIDTSSNLINKSLSTITNGLHGITKGTGDFINAIGETAQRLGTNFRIVSNDTAKGVGNIAKELANTLGSHVKPVPVLGQPSAYLVKASGRGIYYLVVTVSDVAGLVANTLGKTTKKASDVVVFTLTTSSDLVSSRISAASGLATRTVKGVGKVIRPTSSRKSKKTHRRQSAGKRKAIKTKKAIKTRKTRNTRRTRRR